MDTLLIILFGILFLLVFGVWLYLWYFWSQSTYKNITNFSFYKVHVALIIDELPIFIRKILRKYSGFYAEYLVFQMLEKIPGYGKILPNLYLPQGVNITDTEVDLLFIHETGIYCIEVKDYGGWIYGNEFDAKWTQSFSKRLKFHFYNPIRQNYSHIKSLEKLIPDYIEKIRPIIVFSNRSKIKNINCPNHIVIQRRRLPTIFIRKNQTINQIEVDQIFYSLQRYKNHTITQESIHNIEVQRLHA